MVTTFYPPYHFGGEAMYVYRLSNELARVGHRVTVVHCTDAYRTLTSARPRGEFPHHENVTVRPLHSKLGPVSPLVTYLTGRPGLKSRELDEIFHDHQFDVVNFHLVTLFGPGVLSYGSNAVRLYTMHDHWLVCPMYDLWKQNRELCLKPECLRCQLSFHRPPQLWRYTDYLEKQLGEIDLFLAPSHSLMDQHRRRGFSHPMRLLRYFIPASETATETNPMHPQGGRPYFLFVGRLVKIKGVHSLIEAFRHYDRADLLIAGDGPLEEELRELAHGLEHVRFLGRVHPDQLRKLYAESLALLVPTLVYEAGAFVVLEGPAQGAPVIARDLGAAGELVRESGAGFTYRTESELIAAMEAIRESPHLRAELSARARRTSTELWSTEAHMRTYFAAIDEAREIRHGRMDSTLSSA
jgi:glycosyltransferase involved in cell wall biosynthesis